jgi:hypothetical protein
MGESGGNLSPSASLSLIEECTTTTATGQSYHVHAPLYSPIARALTKAEALCVFLCVLGARVHKERRSQAWLALAFCAKRWRAFDAACRTVTQRADKNWAKLNEARRSFSLTFGADSYVEWRERVSNQRPFFNNRTPHSSAMTRDADRICAGNGLKCWIWSESCASYATDHRWISFRVQLCVWKPHYT